MRSEQYQPQLSDRGDRDKWKGRGSKDASTRAADRVREILNGPTQPVLSPEIRGRIDKEVQTVRPIVMDL